MLSSMVRLLTENTHSTKLWPYKKMKTTLQICQKFSNSGRTYFPRKTSSLSFLGPHVRKNSLCFFIATLWNESYSNFALSAILELILLSVHKLPASFLNLRETVLLLCTIFCGSIICLHSYWNNFFFFSGNLRRGKNSFHTCSNVNQTKFKLIFWILQPFLIQHAGNWLCIVNGIFLKKSGQPASWR